MSECKLLCLEKCTHVKKCSGNKSSGFGGAGAGGYICFTFNKSNLPKWKVSKGKVSIIISDGLKKITISFPQYTEKPVMTFIASAVLEVARSGISMSGSYASS